MTAPTTDPLAGGFGLFPPAHVVGTTYTLSLAFFEASVPKLDRAALRRGVILADPHGFRSSRVEAAALRGVGRDDLAAGVPVAGGASYPKVWVLVGDGEAAVLVGSGNLTRSGFIDNAEVFDAVRLTAGGPHRAVADGALAFAEGDEDGELLRALRLVARWWLRTPPWQADWAGCFTSQTPFRRRPGRRGRSCRRRSIGWPPG